MKAGMKPVLIAVSILLLLSLIANGYLYLSVNNGLSENNGLKSQVVGLQSQVSILENQTTNLQSQVNSLESQRANLQGQLSSLQNNSSIISDLNRQIISLQTENKNLQQENDNLRSTIQNLQNQSSAGTGTPYLVTALGATFTWSYSSTARYGMLHYLYVQGTVMNTGNGTAYNCALKVVMTTTSGQSFTDYYRFNSLAPGEVENVDTHFYYENLQSWTITPQCTNTP